MSELQRRSALASISPQPFVERQLELRELGNVAKVRVQGLGPRNVNVLSAKPEFLPTAPNTCAGSDPVALWRAPNDWLVYSATLDAESLMDVLRARGGGLPLLFTDISAAYVGLELRGERSIDVLMRDCTLDLEGDAVKPNHCAQTVLAEVNVLIHRLTDQSVRRLFVERSVAVHVWDWLLDTAAHGAG